MTQIRINALARQFIRFSQIFHEASPESIQEGKRLFLRSPAYTLLASPTERKEWDLLLSPKVISTGNALHSLGYYKKSAPTDQAPPEEWWDTRKKMVHTVRKKIRELR